MSRQLTVATVRRPSSSTRLPPIFSHAAAACPCADKRYRRPTGCAVGLRRSLHQTHFGRGRANRHDVVPRRMSRPHRASLVGMEAAPGQLEEIPRAPSVSQARRAVFSSSACSVGCGRAADHRRRADPTLPAPAHTATARSRRLYSAAKRRRSADLLRRKAASAARQGSLAMAENLPRRAGYRHDAPIHARQSDRVVMDGSRRPIAFVPAQAQMRNWECCSQPLVPRLLGRLTHGPLRVVRGRGRCSTRLRAARDRRSRRAH